MRFKFSSCLDKAVNTICARISIRSTYEYSVIHTLKAVGECKISIDTHKERIQETV